MCHTGEVNHLSRTPDSRPASRWQPPGNRWGLGSSTVVPYLSQTIQSRLASAPVPEDGPIRNPVFTDMGVLVPPRN